MNLNAAAQLPIASFFHATDPDPRNHIFQILATLGMLQKIAIFIQTQYGSLPPNPTSP